jgi:hypothetical protein
MSNTLRVDPEGYAAAAALNPQPPVIVSDSIPPGTSLMDQLLGILLMAANSGDAADSAAAQRGWQERDAMIANALQAFPAQEASNAAAINGIDALNNGVQMFDNTTAAPPNPPDGYVTVCEKYASGGGWVCWDWFMDGSVAGGWSPTDRSGGHP